MRDRPGAWLQDAVLKMGPIFLGALLPSQCCMRDLGLGSIPTGYKLMRRASHGFDRGSALDPRHQMHLSRRNDRRTSKLKNRCGQQQKSREFGRDKHSRGINCMRNYGLARAFAVNPSRLRRDPAGFGDDGSARSSKEDHHAMNADKRLALLNLMRLGNGQLYNRKKTTKKALDSASLI